MLVTSAYKCAALAILREADTLLPWLTAASLIDYIAMRVDEGSDDTVNDLLHAIVPSETAQKILHTLQGTDLHLLEPAPLAAAVRAAEDFAGPLPSTTVSRAISTYIRMTRVT